MPSSISNDYLFIFVLKFLFVPEKNSQKKPFFVVAVVVDEPKASVSIVPRLLHLNSTDSPLNL